MVEIGPNLANALIWVTFWIFLGVSAWKGGTWLDIKLK